MDYFTSDPGWKAFAEANGLPIPTDTIPTPGPIVPVPIDASSARAYQGEADAEWITSHPLSAAGYNSQIQTFTIDGVELNVKVSAPKVERLQERQLSPPYTLPVLFVTHGGGWLSGSHVSEEAWLLWPLYADCDLIVISVEYRLAPEHQFPTWIEDSWGVLCQLFMNSVQFTSGLGVRCDISKLILAGSSAGAAISAVLAQRCRDSSRHLRGVILNVPVLCHYQHFPIETGISGSYKQCIDTFLGSREMAGCWDLVAPPDGKDLRVSPLLGVVDGLAPHLIFVAGRDCLRDEGILYATKLKEAGVAVEIHIYAGVPHNFAHYDELGATVQFHQDLKTGLQKWL